MTLKNDYPFWLTWKGLVVSIFLALAGVAVLMVTAHAIISPILEANHKEYCEARGWKHREAGGRVWCE